MSGGDLFKRFGLLVKSWPGFKADRKDRNLALHIERRARLMFGVPLDDLNKLLKLDDTSTSHSCA